MKKNVKLGLFGLAAGAVGLGGATALGNYLFDLATTPRVHDPARDTDHEDPIFKGRVWLREHPALREAALTAVDGLSLHAYVHYATGAPSHRWAVCVHGFGETAESVGIFGRHYEEWGWNVLLPDLRAHGKSEGRYVTFGWEDRLDLVSWCSWIIRRDPQAEIILHGISMGGTAALLTAGGPLPKQVKGIISDCAFTNAHDIISCVYQQRYSRLGPFTVMWPALRSAMRRKLKIDLNKVDAVAAVRRSSTPTLFIHGVGDELVPPAMMADLYEHARCPKEFLWVPKAGHTRACPTAPDLYWSTVDQWLESLL